VPCEMESPKTKTHGHPLSKTPAPTPTRSQATPCKAPSPSSPAAPSQTAPASPTTRAPPGRTPSCGTCTRDQAHWDKSTTILDQWGSNLTSVIGTDRSLLVGLDGQFFVNAAEIMRWEGNWTEADTSYKGGKGFSVQLYWLFARQSIIVGQANYGMASITAGPAELRGVPGRPVDVQLRPGYVPERPVRRSAR
jgi:hypothetical protein